MSPRLTGHTEHLVLLAVVRLEGNAYAVSIRQELQQQAEVEISRGSVYVILDRLEEKGLVRSSFSDPTPERGGKAKRLFTATAAGRAALRESWEALKRMRAGLEVIGDEA